MFKLYDLRIDYTYHLKKLGVCNWNQCEQYNLNASSNILCCGIQNRSQPPDNFLRKLESILIRYFIAKVIRGFQ